MAGNRGRFWSAHEVTSMLDIFIEQNFGGVLFSAGARRNEHAFAHASRELRLLGYFRVSSQCRSKFKLLRQQFNLVLINFGPDPPEQHQSPYWPRMKTLWRQARRPHPGHAFPAAAGPAQGIGLRQMARYRVVPAVNAALFNPQNEPDNEDGEGGERENMDDDDQLQPGVDVMQLGVRRRELEQVIAQIQDLAERVAALEADVQQMREELLRPRRRRRQRN